MSQNRDEATLECVICDGEFYVSDMTVLKLTVTRMDDNDSVSKNMDVCRNCATGIIKDFKSCLAGKQMELF